MAKKDELIFVFIDFEFEIDFQIQVQDSTERIKHSPGGNWVQKIIFNMFSKQYLTKFPTLEIPKTKIHVQHASDRHINACIREQFCKGAGRPAQKVSTLKYQRLDTLTKDNVLKCKNFVST